MVFSEYFKNGNLSMLLNNVSIPKVCFVYNFTLVNKNLLIAPMLAIWFFRIYNLINN